MRADLKQDLIRDEGLRLKPYFDTVKKMTLGVGRNLSDLGITETEAMMLLDNDLDRVDAELDRQIAWWRKQPDGVQRALANMCFNLGWPKLSEFHNLLASLRVNDYEAAAKAALDSAWATQVGDRAKRIAELFRHG